MVSPKWHPTEDSERPPTAIMHQPASPRFPFGTPISGAQRKIAIPVDLSDESAYAVKWAVQNYLRPGDAVILLHVRPTSVLYGADWGAIDLSLVSEAASAASDEESQQKLEDDFDNFTTFHIVKDHDMKERLCLEVERLGLSAVIMGSRGFGASRRSAKGRLGTVSDYCVQHCVCPVVVVRYPEEKDGGEGPTKSAVDRIPALHPVPEEEPIYHDASDKATDMENAS
ncbi:PREDICTED: universal stress protein PHOS34-like isoform X2 [Ipomoea nil]|uniref:universal stress protein PHOS34-like isoform X2 n=1 Tax=Ipomoea nil TaxID=35883 RepID=UPI000901BE87|nr:PREDICTED: universal stress protein PHOS34-like isoform X2 [Ipomoea nil]